MTSAYLTVGTLKQFIMIPALTIIELQDGHCAVTSCLQQCDGGMRTTHAATPVTHEAPSCWTLQTHDLEVSRQSSPNRSNRDRDGVFEP
jgi:hypothetical protein